MAIITTQTEFVGKTVTVVTDTNASKTFEVQYQYLDVDGESCVVDEYDQSFPVSDIISIP